MYQFIETICYNNGVFERIELHNNRCNRTRNHFFGKLPTIHLESVLSIPGPLIDKKVKCTVNYGIELNNIEYSLYQIRQIKSLQLVYNDTLDYSFKFADRSKLQRLYDLKGKCDDILIVKDGFLIDSFYANTIYLRDKRWYSHTIPLLFGTRLESYLKEGLITSSPIRLSELHLFKEVRIINAMISIEDSPIIPIEAILF